MWNKSSTYLAVFALTLLLFGGCKSENLTSAAELPKQMQQGQSVGKPGAPVSLKNNNPIHVEGIGVYEFELDLLVSRGDRRIVANEAGRFMRVLVSSSDGIEILAGQSAFEFDRNLSREYRLPLTINVRQLGRHYIKLHISLDENGSISTRALTAIVQAGKAPAKAQKTALPSSSMTDGITLLPAQETISPQ